MRIRRDLFKFPLNRSDTKSLKKIGQVGRDVLDSLDLLSGLKACWIENYELVIHKASAFYWRDIESGIINAIKIAFGKEAEEEDVKKPKKRYCRCQSKENPRTCLMASEVHEEIESVS